MPYLPPHNALAGKREYLFKNDTGDAQITVYDLFPGVEVAYVSVHMDHFDFAETEPSFRDRYVGFHYCKEGRIEQESDGEFFYLMPGDCSVVIRDKRVKCFSLPLHHFHGISISIDTGVVGERFARFMENEDITPLRIASRLCGRQHSAILRNVEPLRHIFAESYQVEEGLRHEYLKVKLLELLYVLYQTDAVETEAVSVPRAQADLVKRVAAYITKNIHARHSLTALSGRFGVSDTYLQASFRAVYGMPVISFVRVQKMQRAAQVLIHTERSVEDIADEFGYANESKFSAAFRRIMGDTPSTYRREHSQIRIL